VRASTPRERGLAIVWIALANAIGGFSYPAQKAALEGLPPATVTLLRNVVALLALVVLARARRVSFRSWSRRDLGRVFLLGTAAFGLPMYLGIAGVERSSAANGSILILLEPVTIIAIAGLLLGEKIGAAKLASIVLGLAGALAIVLEGASLDDLLAGEHSLGNAILALHGILWGCYTPLAKPLSEKHDAIALCLLTTAFSLLLLGPAAFLERGEWRAGPELVPALLWCLAIGLFVSFLSTFLWLAALRHIPSTSVAGFVFLQPLAGVCAGILFLGERLSTATWIGGVLIVVGVALDAVATAARGRSRGQLDG
jgi:drug/metabolite transporter (DMT)-like permease